jgi:hypothetical protein
VRPARCAVHARVRGTLCTASNSYFDPRSQKIGWVHRITHAGTPGLTRPAGRVVEYDITGRPIMAFDFDISERESAFTEAVFIGRRCYFSAAPSGA